MCRASTPFTVVPPTSRRARKTDRRADAQACAQLDHRSFHRWTAAEARRPNPPKPPGPSDHAHPTHAPFASPTTSARPRSTCPRGRGDLARERAVAFDDTILGGEDGTVIGYRNEGTDDVFTYRRRFDELDVDDLASHLGHEVVGHLVGNFDHPRLDVRGRSRSVPHEVDELIEELLEADAAGG